MINNYHTAHWHIKPQSDDEQGINKLRPYCLLVLLLLFCIFFFSDICLLLAFVFFCCLLFSSILLIYFALHLYCLLICSSCSFYRFLLSLPILSLSLFIQLEFLVSFVKFQDMFCSILFWLTHWESTVQAFPFVVSFHLPHQCNLIVIISLIVPLLLSFMYSFLHYLSFSSVQHFVLPAISSLILFFNLLFYSLHFSMLIFSCQLLCLFQFPRFRLSAVLFFRKCSNSFFSCSSIIFLIFLSSSLFT